MASHPIMSNVLSKRFAGRRLAERESKDQQLTDDFLHTRSLSRRSGEAAEPDLTLALRASSVQATLSAWPFLLTVTTGSNSREDGRDRCSARNPSRRVARAAAPRRYNRRASRASRDRSANAMEPISGPSAASSEGGNRRRVISAPLPQRSEAAHEADGRRS